ncbi:Os12g0465600, partial [Oryza sativa Japonica Group]
SLGEEVEKLTELLANSRDGQQVNVNPLVMSTSSTT